TKRPFSLLCGYPMDQLAGDGLAPSLDRTCAAHSSVVPTEAYTELDSSGERRGPGRAARSRRVHFHRVPRAAYADFGAHRPGPADVASTGTPGPARAG